MDLPDGNTANPTIDFGFVSPCDGSIGDLVWHDLNRDGFQDAGEPGIPNVSVKLTGTDVAGNPVSMTDITDGSGNYLFLGLCEGTYVVNVDLATVPTGFEPTTPCSDDQAIGNDSNSDDTSTCTPSQTVDLPDGNTDNPTIDFGFITPDCTLKVTKTCFVQAPTSDFDCSDAKPIDTLTMIWGGTETVKVVAHKGKKVRDPVVGTINDIMFGTEVTISGFGGKTDVMWEIFDDNSGSPTYGHKIGESIFHLSCSDQDMNGPEDCGTWQGDGKKNDSKFINDWEFAGMAGDLTLDCDPTPPVGSDKCTVPAGGGDVEYTYKVTNMGNQHVAIITVDDDIFGSLIHLIIPPEKTSLAPGESTSFGLTEFVDMDTENVVMVTGETVAGATCSATDSVKVIVMSLPFECTKPIDELTMIWNGTQPIRIKAWKGKVGRSVLMADSNNDIAVGDEVTVNGYAGSPNDVIWEIFAADTGEKIGESTFHLSCSDKDMNGPEDCCKPQGDGKKNKSNYINDWLLEGMVDKTSSFDCIP